MEKNTTKTEVREKIQELLKTLKAEQEKKPLRLVEQLGYLMYVRLFIESQKRVSLQESFPFAGFPMEWIPGERRSGGWSAQLAAAVSGTVLFFHGGAGTFYGNCEDWKKTVCG